MRRSHARAGSADPIKRRKFHPQKTQNTPPSIMHTTSSRTLILFTLVTLFGAAAVLSAPKPQKIKGDLDGTIVFTPPNVAAGIYGIKVECTGALSSFGRTQVVWEGSASLDS